MNRKVINTLKFFVGFAILFYLVYRIGFLEIFSALKTVQPLFFIVALFAIFSEHALNGFTYMTMVNRLGNSLVDFMTMSFKAWSFGVFTPGRVGDVSMVYLLGKKGVGYAEGSAYYLMNRLIMLSIFVAFSIYGIISYEITSVIVDVPKGLYIILFAATGIIIFLVPGIRKKLLSLLSGIFSLKISDFLGTVKDILFQRKTLLFNVFIINITKVCVTNFCTMTLFSLFNMHISFIDVCIFFSISGILSLLPISINGLGVKETALVFLLGKYCQINYASCMALLLLIQFVIYMTAMFGNLFVPLPLKNRNNES